MGNVRIAARVLIPLWFLLDMNCVSAVRKAVPYQEVPPLSLRSLSSTNSVENRQPDSIEQNENTFTYRGLVILDAFVSELTELKNDGVIGENNRGLLSNMLQQPGVDVPGRIREKYKSNSDHAEMLQETIQQVNMAREFLMQGYILNKKRANRDYNPDMNSLLKLQGKNYQRFLQKGEFLQNENGTWIRKK